MVTLYAPIPQNGQTHSNVFTVFDQRVNFEFANKLYDMIQ